MLDLLSQLTRFDPYHLLNFMIFFFFFFFYNFIMFIHIRVAKVYEDLCLVKWLRMFCFEMGSCS